MRWTNELLRAITFLDAKRTFTKEILMRIDLLKLAKKINKQYLKTELNRLNEIYKFSLTLDLWDKFLNEMTPVYRGQLEMFK